MSFDDDVRDAVQDMMGTAGMGADGTYHSELQGDVALLADDGRGVFIERAAEVEDAEGLLIRIPMATMPAGLVDKPMKGDFIVSGQAQWNVERLISDDGFLVKLELSRRPE